MHGAPSTLLARVRTCKSGPGLCVSSTPPPRDIPYLGMTVCSSYASASSCWEHILGNLQGICTWRATQGASQTV